MAESILIVEDEPLVAEELAFHLRAFGYDIAGAVSQSEEVFPVVENTKPDLILMDIVLRGAKDGIETAEKVRSRFDIPVVYLTGYLEQDNVDRVKSTEPYGYLGKPIVPGELRNTIGAALQKHRADRRVRDSERRFRTLVNTLPYGVQEIDTAGTITFSSPRTAAILGCAEDKLEGKAIWDVLGHTAAHDDLRQWITYPAHKQPAPIPYVTEAERKDGSVVSLQIDWDYKHDAHGNLAGFVLLISDITERKRAKDHLVRTVAELRKANSEIRLLLEISQALLNCRDFHESAERIFEAAKSATGATAGYVALISRNELENDVLFVDSGGVACTVDPNLAMPIRGLRETAYRTKATVYENAFDKSRWVQFLPKGHMTLENVLFAPLTVDGKAAGVMGLANKPGGFDENDVGLVTGFAEFAALGLRNNWAEEKIMRNNEFLNSVINSLAHPFYVIDAHDFTIKMANSGSHLGDPSADLTCHQATHGCPHPCKGEDILCPIEEIRRTGRSVTVEHIHTDEAGESRFVEVHAHPIFDAEGNLVQVIQSQLDISARKKAEIELKTAKDFAERLLDAQMDTVCLFSPRTGRPIRWNSAFRTVSGYRDDEIASMKVPDDFYSREDLKHLHAATRTLLETGSVSIELPLLTKHGRSVPFEYHVGLIEDEDTGAVNVLALGRDISQRKADQDRQRQLNEEIKHFTYFVSHDLRAPLVNLNGFCSELERAMDTVIPTVKQTLDALPPEEQVPVQCALEEDIPESMHFIRSSVSRIDRLINSVLKLSRLGHTELDFQPLNMNRLIEETLRSMGHQIQQRQIRVAVDNVPEIVGDRTALEQIVGNLLDNAIKYLDRQRQGMIRISGWTQGNEHVFQVQDNGEGIDEADLDRVFQIFQRSGAHDIPGEGMGLAYVRTLVRRHHGRIWCESTPGNGSTFVFTISSRLVEGKEVL